MKISENLISQLGRMYILANVDNDFSSKEIDYIKNYCERFGVDYHEFEETYLVEQHFEVIPETPEEKMNALYDLTVLCYADGEISENEIKMLHKIAANFSMDSKLIKPVIDTLIEGVKSSLSLNDLNFKL